MKRTTDYGATTLVRSVDLISLYRTTRTIRNIVQRNVNHNHRDNRTLVGMLNGLNKNMLTLDAYLSEANKCLIED